MKNHNIYIYVYLTDCYMSNNRITIVLSDSQAKFFKINPNLNVSSFIRESIDGHPQYADWKYERDKCGYRG